MLALNKRVTKVSRRKAGASTLPFAGKSGACTRISASTEIFRPFMDKINRKSGKTVFIVPFFELEQSTATCTHRLARRPSVLSRQYNFRIFFACRTSGRSFPLFRHILMHHEMAYTKKGACGSFFCICHHDVRLARRRSISVRYRLRRRILLGVTSTSSSSSMNSTAYSSDIWMGGTSRTASSVPAARILVNCFPLIGLTTISFSREWIPMIMPS